MRWLNRIRRRGRAGLFSAAALGTVIAFLCMPFSFIRIMVRRLVRIRLRGLAVLLSLAIVAVIVYLCMQYSLVRIDDGGGCIVVKWIGVPYEKRDSLLDRITEKFLSPEAMAFRAVVYAYSKESWEIEYSRMGMVSLYSVFAHGWGGAPKARFSPWVSLYTGQMLSRTDNGEIKPVEIGECHAWDGAATIYCKVTAQRHRRDQLSSPERLSVKQCSIDDCWSLRLGGDDVFVVFDRKGLFVRAPWSFVFRGYRWKRE